MRKVWLNGDQWSGYSIEELSESSSGFLVRVKNKELDRIKTVVEEYWKIQKLLGDLEFEYIPFEDEYIAAPGEQ